VREWQRNALLGLVGALAATASGAAVNVRDRVATLEERRDADLRVKAEHDAWLEKAVNDIREDVRTIRAKVAP